MALLDDENRILIVNANVIKLNDDIDEWTVEKNSIAFYQYWTFDPPHYFQPESREVSIRLVNTGDFSVELVVNAYAWQSPSSGRWVVPLHGIRIDLANPIPPSDEGTANIEQMFITLLSQNNLYLQVMANINIDDSTNIWLVETGSIAFEAHGALPPGNLLFEQQQVRVNLADTSYPMDGLGWDVTVAVWKNNNTGRLWIQLGTIATVQPIIHLWDRWVDKNHKTRRQ